LALEAPTSLDPAVTEDVYTSAVVNQIFSGLLRFDSDLNLLPDVAQSWTISRDGREYTFTLREDARFHNGRIVTSEDFVYTFTRLFSPEIPSRIIQDYLHLIDGVADYTAGTADTVRGLVAPDPTTLIIRLERPYPSFMSVLCMDQAKVVPREEVERLGLEEFGRQPVGSGPFRLASWDPGEGMTLVANPDYFGSPAYLDSVLIRHFPADQGQSEREAFRTGRLDVTEVNQNEADRLERGGACRTVRRLELSMEFLGFRTEGPPFDDPRVRRAITMALDREALKRTAGRGFETPMGILPPGMPGYTPRPKILPENPERARELLAEAGYGPQRPLRFDLYSSSRTPHAATRDSVISASLARVGIVANVRKVSWRELNHVIDNHLAPAFQITWIADLPDPDSFLFTLLSSEGTYNMLNYGNREVDSLLAAGRAATDPARRLDLYRRAEEKILLDAPLVPVFNVMVIYAFQPWVRGVEMSPFGLCSIPMEKIWLQQEEGELHARL
jgi:ABC-type transport system substrate-binding protein